MAVRLTSAGHGMTPHTRCMPVAIASCCNRFKHPRRGAECKLYQCTIIEHTLTGCRTCRLSDDRCFEWQPGSGVGEPSPVGRPAPLAHYCTSYVGP